MVPTTPPTNSLVMMSSIAAAQHTATVLAVAPTMSSTTSITTMTNRPGATKRTCG